MIQSMLEYAQWITVPMGALLIAGLLVLWRFHRLELHAFVEAEREKERMRRFCPHGGTESKCPACLERFFAEPPKKECPPPNPPKLLLPDLPQDAVMNPSFPRLLTLKCPEIVGDVQLEVSTNELAKMSDIYFVERFFPGPAGQRGYKTITQFTAGWPPGSYNYCLYIQPGGVISRLMLPALRGLTYIRLRFNGCVIAEGSPENLAALQ